MSKRVYSLYRASTKGQVEKDDIPMQKQRCREFAAEMWEAEVTLADGVQVTVERPPRMTPKKNVGRALLSGNVYCGHCGGRIFASTACRSHDPNDRISTYKCYNRTQHKTLCDGPTTYRAEKVDAVAEQIDILQEQEIETEVMAKEIRESHQTVQGEPQQKCLGSGTDQYV